MKIHGNPLTDPETSLHKDPLECAGCHHHYGLTVRTDDSLNPDRFCGSCFAHMFGLKNYHKVYTTLNLIQIDLWEIPYAELPQEVKDGLRNIWGEKVE